MGQLKLLFAEVLLEHLEQIAHQEGQGQLNQLLLEYGEGEELRLKQLESAFLAVEDLQQEILFQLVQLSSHSQLCGLLHVLYHAHIVEASYDWGEEGDGFNGNHGEGEVQNDDLLGHQAECRS